MSAAATEDTKQNRERWVAALRSQGHRQVCGQYRADDGRVCATMLMAEVCGVDPLKGGEGIGNWERRLCGLTTDQVLEVMSLNDKGKTFAEIADVVEQWS